MKRISGKLIAWIVALAGMAVTIGPLVRHGDLPIPIHHLVHALAIAGGAALALALMRRSADDAEHPIWLAPAIAAPVAMMFLMWPSIYSSLDAHPVLHVADHLALFFIGTAVVGCGQRYRAGAGWALGVLTVIMALTSAGGFGAYV